MPTPYGSRGGMAFGVAELRVLRRALALALNPVPASAEDVQDCLRLAESLDEAMREGARARAFLVADLARYRAALPGTAAGYLTLLQEALGAGYRPGPDDLAALRALRGAPVAASLLQRCRRFAAAGAPLGPSAGSRVPSAAPTAPASRTRLLALPGGRSGGTHGEPPEVCCAVAEGAGEKPRKKPAEKPAPDPSAPKPAPAPPGPAPTPEPVRRRPIPTPGEVFPRRKPTQPPARPSQQLAAV